MKRIEIKTGNLLLTEGEIGFFQKTVTKFGTGANIGYMPDNLLKFKK